MRAWLVVLCLVLAAAAFAQDAPVASPVPHALTDAERCSVDSLAQRATIMALRGELAKLTARIAELEAPLVNEAVAKERASLEAQFRERLKPPEGSTFNWQTLTFVAPKAQEPKP
ncbi:MAG: hypothetical protein IPO08_21560 [Xanthomonadales bacterium]|nr:hypothetical protein [Xanthomonadales bacterium]